MEETLENPQCAQLGYKNIYKNSNKGSISQDDILSLQGFENTVVSSSLPCEGLTVVIRCPDSNNTNSTTGGTALPKFAIRGMLTTFGLHGVVLAVDSGSVGDS